MQPLNQSYSSSPIGVFDSGYGGLTILRSMRRLLPQYDYLYLGDNARALNLACRLRDAGCWATAIRPPTVPVGSARLRLTLTAAHHTEDINRLLEVLHGHSE